MATISTSKTQVSNLNFLMHRFDRSPTWWRSYSGYFEVLPEFEAEGHLIRVIDNALEGHVLFILILY